jgi:hypothetical protein
MRLDVKIDPASLRSVQAALDKLSGPEMRAGMAKALNDTGFQVRRAMQAEMRRVFDRPTGYILSSPRVVMAKPDDLSVKIEPTYMGGKGIDPQKILQAQAFGGQRADKRSESALRRVGILPPGYQTAIPRSPLPGSDDGRGNLRGPFLRQLLSYLQAGYDNKDRKGYINNMTDKRRRKLADKTLVSSIATRKTYKVTRGVEYFVSYGRLRGGPSSHLAPGVWARSGMHGVEVKPVLMFVRSGSYTPRLVMDDITKSAGAQEYLDRRIRYRIRQAAGL